MAHGEPGLVPQVSGKFDYEAELGVVLGERVNLRSLKAGNRYSAFFNPDSSLASFQLTVDGSGASAITPSGSFSSEWIVWPPAWFVPVQKSNQVVPAGR